MENKTVKAYEQFKKNNFYNALKLYKELAKEFGMNIYSANIELCKRRIHELEENTENIQNNIHPKVSVLVPVYNNTKYLHECLDSIINQTLKDIEIIIINDGSTDIEVTNILNYYSSKDKRIKLIHKENTGYGHSMNLAINLAQGEYLGIVESDDYISEDMYYILYSKAKQHSLDIIKSNIATVIGEQNNRKITDFELVDKQYYNKILSPSNNPQVFDYSGFLAIWSALYSASFIKKNKLFFSETPGASYQDIAFWFKGICLSQKYLYLDKTLYFARRDNENSSVHDTKKLYPVCYEFMQIKKFLNINEKEKNIFYKFYIKRMFLSYKWNLERTTHDLKEKFKERFASDFLELKIINRLYLDYFNNREKQYLDNILKNNNKIACIYTAHLAGGGLERTACDLSFILKEQGYIVYFILIYPNKISYEYYGEILYKNLKDPILKKVLQDCDVFFDYKYKDKTKDDDLIKYCIDNYSHKYIATIHNESDRVQHYFNITNKYLNNNIEKLKKIICVSKKVKKSFEYYYGIHNNVIVIYNMIDLEKIKRLTKLATNKHDKNYILFAGRLDAYYIKGLDILIPAFLDSKTSDNTYLMLAGSGNISLELQKIIQEHPNGNKICFLGFVDLLQEGWLKHCNFLVAPSRYEGFSMILLEALASSVPVLTSNAGGASELITQGYNGYILKELSIKNLTQAIDTMSSTYEQMKKNCVESVEKFDKNKIKQEFYKILQSPTVISNKKSSRPYISTIIPVYNAEKYINNCIKSVLNQNIGNFEIICIDDGSTDNCKDIIKSINDTRIKYYYQKNSGPGIARNKGISLASGEYIAFLDSDDMLPHSYTYDKLYKNAKKYSANISGGNLYYIDNEEKLVPCKNKEMIFSQNCIIFYNDWQYDYCYQNFIYNTDFLKSNNLLFPNYKRFQDPVFFSKSMYASQKFCVTNDYSYCYRVRQDKKNWIWSEVMVHDLIKAATENLIFSLKYNLSTLHNYTIIHLDSFVSYITKNLNNTTKELLINFIKNINMDYIKNYNLENINIFKVIN